MNNLNVKRGDTVLVLTGKDKGKKGKILTANPTKESVTVEGVNIVTKHVKPRGAQKPGGMQKVPGNTHVSNVMLVCPACAQATRIAHTIIEESGKKKSVRVCKKCGVSIDKAAKSEVKKSAKKAAKTDSVAETKKKPAKKVKKTDDESTPIAAIAEEQASSAEQTEKAEDKA